LITLFTFALFSIASAQTPAANQQSDVTQASVLQNTAWTPPTLAGSKLYLRDRKNLMALDLAAK
jgi:hypothetical protein